MVWWKVGEVDIREVIERLRDLAEILPNGMDSQVRVKICNGQSESGFSTRTVEVDAAWTQEGLSGDVVEAYAALIGHPHDDVQSLTPAVLGLEEAVAAWSAEVNQSPTAPTAADVDTGQLSTVGEQPPGRLAVAPESHGPGMLTEVDVA